MNGVRKIPPGEFPRSNSRQKNPPGEFPYDEFPPPSPIFFLLNFPRSEISLQEPQAYLSISLQESQACLSISLV